jgi:hypothetical protein
LCQTWKRAFLNIAHITIILRADEKVAVIPYRHIETKGDFKNPVYRELVLTNTKSSTFAGLPIGPDPLLRSFNHNEKNH